VSDVRVESITKRFRSIVALDDVSFEVLDGEFFVLLGPTGAGKTTTLRTIAGLEKQDEGQIYFDGEPVKDFSPAERDVAFVFQQYSLYPTMTVFENLAFPLKSPQRKWAKGDIEQRVSEVAQILRIDHLVDRKTANLSGGEMQRVSIGRAIVRTPRIYLMDEPLSNLDAKLREALRIELKHLQHTQKSTVLFVTHDQVEALTLADRIGVLRRGRMEQVGSPTDIYDRPASVNVAQLVGSPRINLLPATLCDSTVMITGTQIHVPVTKNQAMRLTGAFTLGVRPEDVVVAADGTYQGSLSLIEPLGIETVLHIQCNGQTVVSLASGMVDYSVGDNLRFSLSRDRLHFFDAKGIRL
jgi:multiple sugar transport system ATP-binding protein